MERRESSLEEHRTKYHGFDTETPLGWLKVIATEKEKREIKSFSELLAFLNQKKFRGCIFFTFNLRFDAEHVLKLTKDMEFLKKLYFEGAKPEGIEYNENVKVRYIPSKFLRFCFRHGTHYNCVSFYDIAQFYSGWRLNDVAKKYLGDYKNPIDGERLGSEEGYYEARKEEVLEYCRKDADLTLRAAMLMKKTMETVKMPRGNLSFRNPISQAKISEMYIHDNFKYPNVPEALDFFHWISEQAYHGGIFSTERRGLFSMDLYSYDICSAYPFQMKQLPHWANGVFQHVEKPDEIDTRYGWFLCRFNCPYISYPDYSHPYKVEFCYSDVDPDHCEEVLVNPKRVVYPNGMRRQWVTKIEYEWMEKMGFEPEMRGGVVWEQKKEEYENPFSWIEEVYNARRKIKEADSEDIRQMALKIAMNGAYGKTAQKKKGRGALTNFFYSSYITAGTRLQICDVMMQKPESIVEIATDSILSTEPLSVNVSEKLGEWSFNKYIKALVIGSGIRQQWINDEEFVTHARGLTYKNNWNMMKEIREGRNEKEGRDNIDCDYLYFEKTRPIHLGELIFHHKLLKLEDLGVFTKVSKRLSVNTDKKRRWEREYKDFGDLLRSAPMRSEPLVLGEDV
jgi:hypothetical protein